MDKLICVITGPPRNGTTYFKYILDSHPDIFSGFETGILLDEDFNKSIPFRDWIYKNTFHWGVPKNISLFDKSLSIHDKYKLLFENKGSYGGYYQSLIKKSKYIVDKTPAYFQDLPKVCKLLDNKDIPILITIKSYQHCYYSNCVKRNTSLSKFIEDTKNYIKTLEWLKVNKKKNLQNIYLFRYEDIIKPEFIKKLKQIIGKRIDVNYELSYDMYFSKLSEQYKNSNEGKNIPYSKWIKTNSTEYPNIPLNLKEIQSKYDSLIDILKEEI